jgi:hypothetical protein
MVPLTLVSRAAEYPRSWVCSARAGSQQAMAQVSTA